MERRFEGSVRNEEPLKAGGRKGGRKKSDRGDKMNVSVVFKDNIILS